MNIKIACFLHAHDDAALLTAVHAGSILMKSIDWNQWDRDRITFQHYTAHPVLTETKASAVRLIAKDFK